MYPEGILLGILIVVNLPKFNDTKPEKGGIFEYCPNIRTPGNENFGEVKKFLMVIDR